MPYLLGAPFPGSRIVLPGDLQFLLPKTGDVDGGGGHMVWSCPGTSSQSIVMPGVAGVTYNVTIRIVGVVEVAKYTGGTTSSTYFNVDGTPIGGGQNVYKIVTSNPSHTYFLNASWSGSGFPAVVAIDYQKTIPVVGGSTISLLADAGDGLEEKHSISVSGITNPGQPYLGQWIDVFSLSVS